MARTYKRTRTLQTSKRKGVNNLARALRQLASFSATISNRKCFFLQSPWPSSTFPRICDVLCIKLGFAMHPSIPRKLQGRKSLMQSSSAGRMPNAYQPDPLLRLPTFPGPCRNKTKKGRRALVASCRGSLHAFVRFGRSARQLPAAQKIRLPAGAKTYPTLHPFQAV